MIFLVICAATLFWCGGAEDNNSYVGRAVYLPDYDLLGDDMSGGYPVFKALPKECVTVSHNPIVDSSSTFYEDTSTFYSSFGTESSISGELQVDFSLSSSLDATTKSISGSDRTVRGTTYHSYSKVSSDFLQMSCFGEELNDNLRNDFEALAAAIDNPSPESSWSAYRAFLTTYGSHIIREVFYGSSFYQHAFSDSKKEYTQKELNTKACASFGFGIANTSVCNGITQEDINAISSLTMSERFIARGGTDQTRTQMYANRSAELISKFLNEAHATHQPIQYKFIPIWVILQNQYLGTDHFTKAINMEAYYKGYLNYDCAYRTDNVVLQKFEHSDQSTPDYPMYQSVLSFSLWLSRQ